MCHDLTKMILIALPNNRKEQAQKMYRKLWFYSRHCWWRGVVCADDGITESNCRTVARSKRVLESGDMAKIREVLLALQKAFNESKSYENYRLF